MRFPIKLKIFLGVTLLLLFVLGFNLYFSSQLFIKDKTNYVYESSLQRLEDLSFQLQNPIGQSIKNIRPYILLAGENSEQFESIFSSNETMRLFAFKTEQEEWKVFKKEQDIELDGWIQANKAKFKLTNKINIKGIKVDGKDYLQVAISVDKVDIVTLLDYSIFRDLISSSKLFSYYLLYDDGRHFIPGAKENVSHLSSVLKNSFIKGTQKVVNGDEELLVSYIKISEFGINLVSSIKSKNAFKAAQELIKRSFFVGMIILGATIIFSLIFSTRLTKPILSLYKATQSFSSGDLNSKVHINTSDELKTLGEGFNSMIDQIGALLEDQKKMILKLEDYNQNLERMVSERTAELQEANNFIEAMINSLNQGLLVFDQNLNIASTYTKSCNDIFQMEIENKTYGDILGLDDSKKAILKKGVDLVYSEKLPFKSSTKLINQDRIIGDSFEDTNFKHIALEYFPMRNKENDSLTHIVVVATDKTEEVKAVEAFKAKEAYVNMITKLVGNKKQFMNYLSDVRKSLKIIADELEKETPNPDLILMQYHTINGGSGTYSAMKLQKTARSNEQKIIDQKDAGKLSNKDLFKDYNYCVEVYKELQEEINNVLGNNVNTLEIDKKVIDVLSEKIRQQVDRQTYHYFEEQFYHEPVESYVSEYINLTKTVARKTGKKIYPLDIQGGDIRIPPLKIDSFFSSLVHLFRNCVDHGIEKPAKRKKLEKDPQGKITIQFDKTLKNEHPYLNILVTDDGGGINPDIIRKKWAELNPDDKSVEFLSDEEVIYKIFDPAFSTTDQLSEFSGRGVGMSAIKETVEELGGNLNLISQVNSGSKFEFNLPLS